MYVTTTSLCHPCTSLDTLKFQPNDIIAGHGSEQLLARFRHSPNQAQTSKMSQQTVCRQMIFDIMTLSGHLIRENHNIALAIQGYSLALNITHLENRIIEHENIPTTSADVAMYAELALYKQQTSSMLASIRTARMKYWNDGDLGKSFSDNSSRQKVITPKMFDMFDVNWTSILPSALLFNMSLGYSALHADTAALQSYQLAYECLSFISNTYKAAVMRLHILREMEEIVKPMSDRDEQAAGIAQQICEELFMTEVAILSGCASAASAA